MGISELKKKFDNMVEASNVYYKANPSSRHYKISDKYYLFFQFYFEGSKPKCIKYGVFANNPWAGWRGTLEQFPTNKQYTPEEKQKHDYYCNLAKQYLQNELDDMPPASIK